MSRNATSCRGFRWRAALVLGALWLTIDVDVAEAEWTLERVLDRAAEHAPTVQRARAQAAVADAHRTFASVPVLDNPIVGVRAMAGVPDASAAIYAIYFGIPFDLSGRQGAWSREADALAEVNEAAVEVARNDARAAAATAFLEVVAADALVELQRGRLRLAEELLQRTETLVAAGAATAVDRALVAAEVGEARASSLGAEREAAAARGELRAILDLDASDPLEIASPGLPRAPDGEVDAWRSRARELRAEPRGLQALGRRLQASEDRLFAESVSPLVVALEWESQGNVRTAHTVGASATTTLPLFRVAQGERAVARSERGVALVELGIAERSVERDVVQAAQMLDASLRELEALETAAIPALEQALEDVLRLLESGATDMFRVLATQRQLFELRERRVGAVRDAWAARIAFERAVGGGP